MSRVLDEAWFEEMGRWLKAKDLVQAAQFLVFKAFWAEHEFRHSDGMWWTVVEMAVAGFSRERIREAMETKCYPEEEIEASPNWERLREALKVLGCRQKELDSREAGERQFEIVSELMCQCFFGEDKREALASLSQEGAESYDEEGNVHPEG